MFRKLTSTSLLGLAGIHAYWGAGGRWPGKDQASLSRKVFAKDDETLPSPVACYALASALALTGAVVQLRSRESRIQCVRQVALGGAATIFLLRGSLGYTLPRYTQAGEEFRQLNRKVYSPLCLTLGVLLLVEKR